MNTLQKTFTGLTLAGILAGCHDSSQGFIKRGTFDGHEVVIGIAGNGRTVRIGNPNNESSYVYACDRDVDGQFDEIFLSEIPKGDPLERYAHLAKLEEVYSSLEKN